METNASLKKCMKTLFTTHVPNESHLTEVIALIMEFYESHSYIYAILVNYFTNVYKLRLN